MTGTRQSDRNCAKCGRRFLSGIAHIDRGVIGAMLCLKCSNAAHPVSYEWMQHLTNQQRKEALAARKATNA